MGFFACVHVMSSFNTCLRQALRLPWVSPARPQRCSAARARLVVSPAQSPGRKDKALTYGFTSWLRLLLPPNSLETGRRILQGFFSSCLRAETLPGWGILAPCCKVQEVPLAVTGTRRAWKPSTFLPKPLLCAPCSPSRSNPQPAAVISAISCKTNQLAPAEVWKVHRGIKLVLPSVLTCENTTY